MIFHSEPIEHILKTLNSDVTFGLSSTQAKYALQKYGKNTLKECRKKSNFERFIEQFKDVMILILITAAIVSFVIACIERNPKEFFEPILILLIVILNAIMGVIQESKAEKALDALKNLSAPSARVLRDGTETVLDASQLVPGDIIHLEAGDFVPADARLLKSVSLKSEESALTGESVPSEKIAGLITDPNAPLGDRSNMIFSGCSITYGTATAIVTATGMNTEMGKIANLLDSEIETQTPLQKKLSQLGKLLGAVALAACGVIFVVGLSNGIPALEIFMTAVSLAVSAIPEGLPAIVTIILSIGVQRMVNKNAIIRKLPAVETLGSASVICSDKTGTLTQNRMTLVEAFVDGHSPEDISNANSPEVKKLLTYATLCCDGTVIFHKDHAEHIGDPTETAIILAAHKNSIEKEQLNQSYPRLAELPFDSDRKLMTTIHRIDGRLIAIIKGAFDVMASRCVAGDLVAAGQMNDAMSEKALRVLAVAYKELDTLPAKPSPKDLENNLTFLGMVGMIDPPRPEAKEAVKICRKAGIKPVMITGDHVVTASAIAKELGILQPGDKSITGTELDAMTDSELDLQIERIGVYARVSPENKIRIVKAWQRKEQVVAMTGDGVNDAPALKAADIGCAMGITGTDVAKGAADITLTDDNFATIVDAVREGRGIYANIKKVVGFLLGTNIGEIVSVFTAMLLWHESPFLSMQLLWINLVTDSFPAIALGMEPIEHDIMEQRPKPKSEGLFARGFGIQIALQGLMFGILTLLAFRIGKGTTGELAAGQTLAFMVLSLSQVVQAFNMRSEHSLFDIGVFSNHKLNWAALSSILLVCLVLFTPLSTLFGLVRLTIPHYVIGLSLIVLPILITELAKTFGLVRQ
ncbi:MAG: cation-translocating P-type ATPase [Roseburia sp.]|nr:cation-translocating P-type ATPase [Roseburia sp.]